MITAWKLHFQHPTTVSGSTSAANATSATPTVTGSTSAASQPVTDTVTERRSTSAASQPGPTARPHAQVKVIFVVISVTWPLFSSSDH